MERLEETFGFRLFNRLPEGVSLTVEGRSVFVSAQQMERASRMMRAQLDEELTTGGMVRCSVTEGIGRSGSCRMSLNSSVRTWRH